MDFKCILFLVVSLIVYRQTEAVYHGYYWSKVELNTQNRPSPRLDASTWVDTTNRLWLYGGRNVSNTSQQFHDLWSYDTKNSKWFNPADGNRSTSPPSNGMSCFCHGLLFLLVGGSGRQALKHKLWVYNASENLWHSEDLPESLEHNNSDPLGLWCDGNTLVLLDYTANISGFVFWYYNILTAKWKSRPLNATGNLTQMVFGTNCVSWTTDSSATKYTYFWHNDALNDSILLSIRDDSLRIEVFQIVGEHPDLTMNFVHWSDPSGYLWVLVGKMCSNDSKPCSQDWVLDVSTRNWVRVGTKQGPRPSPKTAALTWHVKDEVWFLDGSMEKLNTTMVVGGEFWVGHPINDHHVHPIKPISHLPGDSLGLTMTDKLIISGLVLLVVMMISVRLCYKRELNQMLSKLRRRRVPYHQLSQEGDKGSRL